MVGGLTTLSAAACVNPAPNFAFDAVVSGRADEGRDTEGPAVCGRDSACNTGEGALALLCMLFAMFTIFPV